MPTPSTVLPIPVARPAGLPGSVASIADSILLEFGLVGQKQRTADFTPRIHQDEIEFGVALSHLLQPSQRVHVQKSKG
jgi:hypothetical protein